MTAPVEPALVTEIAERTLGHYERHAAGFWEGTRDHDVSQNYAALLGALRGAEGARRILDFGCGPGRDLRALRALGHVPIGLDGCAAFVDMARRHSGCEVWQQSFFDLKLPSAYFDGVFANASLFHVPRALLARVLEQIAETLVPEGVLFCSNPRSFDVDHEAWQGERYGSYLTLETWTREIAASGLVLERHFFRPPGKPLAEQPWLAMVWRKSKAHAQER